MLENAVKTKTESHKPEKDNIRWVHRFAAPVQIGDQLFIANMVVKETTSGQKYYYHDLTEMKMPSGVTAEQGIKSTVAAPADGISTVNIRDILKFVKPEHLPEGWEEEQGVGRQKPGDRRTEERQAGADALEKEHSPRKNILYEVRARREFIPDANGNIDLGHIDKDAGKKIGKMAGPIRLQRGWHDDVTGKGFGQIHVDKRHAGEITGAGYNNITEMVGDVARNYYRMYRGYRGRVKLVKKNGNTKVAVVELRESKDGTYYTVITSFLSRPGSLKKSDLLWERAPSSTPVSGTPLKR
jgi:hypothetical protein